VFNPLKNRCSKELSSLFPERIALRPAFRSKRSDFRSANLNEIAAVFLEALPARLSIDQAALMLRRPSGLDWDLRQNPKGGFGWAHLPGRLGDLEKTEPLRSFWISWLCRTIRRIQDPAALKGQRGGRRFSLEKSG